MRVSKTMIHRLRGRSGPFMYQILLPAGMILFILCFPALAVASERYHDRVICASLGVFALLLISIAAYFTLIALDDCLRRRFATAFWACVAIAMLAWPIVSCVRGVIHYQSR
jgi:hypothetical protein